MSKVKYIEPIKSMHGKVHGNSDFWMMERYGTQYTAHRNNPRDYTQKPQSEGEKAGTLRLAAASKAYNELIKDSPGWQALEQEYLAQRDLPNGKKSFRGYFISKHMKSGI